MNQAPQTLSIVACLEMYNAVSCMSVDSWMQHGSAFESTLLNAGRLLCGLRRCDSLQQYLQKLSGGGGSGSSGPCTCVWTTGTIAYRCHTCELSPSAAICADCFKASDHEGHDYIMYTSDAGGCCDCGDTSSWRPQGCCQLHRPAGRDRRGSPAAAPSLPAVDEALARGIAGCALARLQIALERCAPNGDGEHEAGVALCLVRWLQLLGQHPALRAIICEELLQPAAGSAATHSISLASTQHLQPEVASVSRMLQQQREGLLQRLEQVLSDVQQVPSSSRPLPEAEPNPRSLLYWQLSTLLVRPALVEELATLHILLLYNVPFKYSYGRLLLAFYPAFGALGKRHAVTKALDRLTVQVLHLEETCLELVRQDRMLEVLLGCLLGVLQRGVNAKGVVHGDSPDLADRLYLRIAGDLHQVLMHPLVVLELMSPQAGHRAAALFGPCYLQVFKVLEGASPFRRQLGQHVLYEPTAHLNTAQLEVHLMHFLKQSALHTLLKAAEDGTVAAETAAQALLFAVQRCLEAVELGSGVLQAAIKVPNFWFAGNATMSAHIPLERLAAAFLSGLLHLASVCPQPQAYHAAIRRTLGADERRPAQERQAAVRRWEMCGMAAQRVLSWMSQIRQRLWVRNGQELLRLEAFYTSPFWSDHALNCDLVAVQAWLASTPSLPGSLDIFGFDSGGAVLMAASLAGTATEAAAQLQDTMRHTPEVMRCCSDWLRLLVQVLRDRCIWHPTYSALPLRRALLHTLAVEGPCSHSEAGEELSYELSYSPQFDQVLADLAEYCPPTAATTGQYSLKPERWREFDPFFPHYTPRDLQTALHTAEEGGLWQPEWQLQHALAAAAPCPLDRLQRLLPQLLPVAWTALLGACVSGGSAASGTGGSSGATEDSALAAVNLLCHFLAQQGAEFAALLHCSRSGSSAGGSSSANLGPAQAVPPAQAALASFAATLEEQLEGRPPGRPGVLFMLRVLAGNQAWLDGSSRQASWELKACAAAAAVHAQQLLQSVRQQTDSRGGSQEAAAAAAADPAEPAVVSASESQPAAVGQGQEQEEQGQRPADKQQKGRQRQQQMLARMRAQQARAAAAIQEGDAAAEEEDRGVEEAPHQRAPASPPSLGAAEEMDVDAVRAAAAAAAAQLPAHHPGAWERQRGECVLCHCGSEAGPLGLVAQLSVSHIPVLASVDPAAPLTPEHPGQPAAAIAVAAHPVGSAEGGAPVQAGVLPARFPAPGAGPRLSVFDCHPSLQLLCCGHILHDACLDRYRGSWRQRMASGQFVEGMHLLQSAASAGEYLCPICRRLGNCLLPLAAPSALGDTAEQVPAACERSAARGQAAADAALSSSEALQQLERLVGAEGSWVTAPVTADSSVAQRWQQAHLPAEAGMPASADEVDRLLAARFGCHASGVDELATFALMMGSKWLMSHHRLLAWLQRRGSEHPEEPPLWGIPVPPAVVGAGTQEDTAVALPHSPEGTAFFVRGGLARMAEVLAEENQRLHFNRCMPTAAGSSSVLWCLLGSGIVRWEVVHRSGAGQPARELDAAHWRALQSLAQLALAAGSQDPADHAPALSLLRQLAEGSLQRPSHLSTDMSAALLPTLLQLQVAPMVGADTCSEDPFALLLTLLASLLTRPASPCSPGLNCTAHKQPAAVLQLLLAVVFPVAAGQAAALATGAARSAADVETAMAASRPLAHALENAAASHLLPWLQRCAVLLELLRGSPSPPTSAAGSAAVAAATLLGQLCLPPLASALQSPAAGCLPLDDRSFFDVPGSLEVSMRLGQQQWVVCSPPLPPPPKLMQLPSTYLGWYLSLGKRTCSACGQLPPEPALCLRCGAVVCCSNPLCQGSAQQGMCYTHSLACGGGTCCFLLFKVTRLLVIRQNRASLLASPYVDSHGEEDLRLQRGKPLFLHAAREQHLLQLWRLDGFDFDSHVLHSANHHNELASVY